MFSAFSWDMDRAERKDDVSVPIQAAKEKKWNVPPGGKVKQNKTKPSPMISRD